MMNLSSIRSRMLVAALLPVLLVVIAIVSIHAVNRVEDLRLEHSQRGSLLVRQVAMGSEYGLFSGNSANLINAVESVRREPGVRTVTVFDASGRQLAGAGEPITARLEELGNGRYVESRRRQGVDVWVQTIIPNHILLDDPFTTAGDAQSAERLVLGYAVLEMSQDGLLERKHHAVWIAIGVGLIGLLVGGLLAVRLGERVVLPIYAVSRRLEHIGQGDFSMLDDIAVNDPLRELQIGLNQMANRLAWGRDELEQRVSDVTLELRAKKDEAESATLAKNRFLAAASHDLRQPTHALGLFISRLGQLPLDAQAQQLVASLDVSVQAMQDLLDGLMDLSRLEAGAVQAHIQPVNLGEMLNTVRGALGSLASEKGLRVRLRPSLLWGQSDPVILQRMVLNLASNALRYTERGTVLIACRPVDGGRSVRIDVLDSGIGISPEHQSDIFREFYQVANPGRDRMRGMGLGLNIVKRSAALLGHRITLRSNPGCGTRFSITLPRVDAPLLPPIAMPQELPAAGSLKGVRVWVIEDDVLSREAMQLLLESWECCVKVAINAEQAYAWLPGVPAPDVIVSDYRLGEGDGGLSAIACLRALAGHDIPACLISGDTDAQLLQSVKQAGLTLLHKPVRPAKLRSLLRNLITRV